MEGALKDGDAAAGSRTAGQSATASGFDDSSREMSGRPFPASRMDPVWAVALVAIALAYFSLTLDRTFNLRDEGYHVRMSSRVAAGEVPHRDFAELYGPAVFTTTSLALRAGDGEIIAIRWLIACLKAASVALTFLILRRMTPQSVSLLGGLLAIVYLGRPTINLNTPHGALYTISIGMLALYLLLRSGERRTGTAYFRIGCVIGLGIVYKQTLGLTNAFGIGLALWAIAMLGADIGLGSNRQAPASQRLALAAWFVAAALVLVPGAAYMTLPDYVIHLLPIHLLMGLVAAGIKRRGLRAAPAQIITRRLLPYSAGVLVIPSVVATLYAAWGALPDLIYGMFIYPMSLRNYYLAAWVPGLSLSVFVAGGLLAVSAAMAALRSEKLLALLLGGTSAILLAIGPRLPNADDSIYSLPVIWRSAIVFDWVESSAILAAALLLLYPFIAARRVAGGRQRAPARDGSLDAGTVIRVALPIAFFQAFLCFEAFPRGGHNVWLAQGAFVPLLVIVLYRFYKWGSGAGRRTAAALLGCAIPVWLAAPLLAPVFSLGPEAAFRRPLDLPFTKGIKPIPLDVDTRRIPDVERLIAALERVEPPDAKLLLFSNQQMIYYLSQRTPLILDREFHLFAAASDMIPLAELHGLGDGSVLNALKREPDTIVVIHRDPSSVKLRKALPDVAEFIKRQYEVKQEFGVYRVLRHRTRGQGQGRKTEG